MNGPDGERMQLLLNVGGPDRVSRAQMAETVALVRGYSTSVITLVSASSVCLSTKLFSYVFCVYFSSDNPSGGW